MSRVSLFTSLLLVFSFLPSAPAAEDPLQGLDDYVNKALKDWEVPGLALAVVKDDKLVLIRGYGVRKVGETTPVDGHTVFAIGSVTKSFTAAAVGILVDEGKVRWDDPVARHMPGFQMYDPYVNKEITIRDLLCHRTGLARHELLWYGSKLGRDDILRRLRLIKPDWSFRSKFGYQNMMYLAAGQIVSSVTGKSWDDFLHDRFFVPLGMKETSTSVTKLAALKNVATPHEKIDDKIQCIPYRNIDNIAGAGAINSNVADMSAWLRLHLKDGKWDNKQLLSSGVVREMQTPQTVIRLEGGLARLNPHTHLQAYGFGWMIQDYRDHKLVEHNGGIDGMTSQVAFVPEEKLAIVVLSNRNESLLPTALSYRILDAYLKAPPRDWSGDLLKIVKASEALKKAADKKQEATRVKNTKPSLALDRYAGTYQSDIYGDVKVTLEKDKDREHLVLTFGSFVHDLAHWHYDTFRGTCRDRAVTEKRLFTFVLNAQGKIAEVKLADDSDSDLVFKRTGVEKDRTPVLALSEDQLQRFVGKYELKNPPIEIRVELVGKKLKFVVPGQSTATIVPIKPTRFRLEDGPVGFYVDFAVADGKIKSMTVEQPAGPKVTLERIP